MAKSIYKVSAFTSDPFSGNPACVIPLNEWLSKESMLKISRENAVPETAFFIQKSNNHFALRWFTPELEMDLCGHATLASAHIIKEYFEDINWPITFETASGELLVDYENKLYRMTLPRRKGKICDLSEHLKNALNIQPQEVYKSRDFMLVFKDQRSVENIEIDRDIFNKMDLGTGGVIITAPGVEVDFVSRFFTPKASILEDPVTGSAHCTLVPYWSERLDKKKLLAKQLSNRGGELTCEDKDQQVIVSGRATTYSKGVLTF